MRLSVAPLKDGGARCINDEHNECMATSEQQPPNHYAITCTCKLVTTAQKPAIL